MADVKTYRKLRDVKEGERFGAHVGAILFALRDGDKTRDQVVKAVEKKLGENTVQPASRIVSFQTPRMVEKGLIKVVKTSAPDAPAKSKPAKKAAAKPAKKAAKKKAAKKQPAPAAETQPEAEMATATAE